MGLLKVLNERSRLEKKDISHGKQFAQELYEQAKCKGLNGDFAYICGLLHNIGKINRGGHTALDSIFILQNENMTDVVNVLISFYDMQKIFNSYGIPHYLVQYADLMKDVKVKMEGIHEN